TAAIEGWSNGLAAHAPSEVEKTTGVAAARIERIARGLVEHGPAVAIVGGAPLAHTNGLFTAVAVHPLNALLGTVGRPGGISFMPQAGPPSALAAQSLAHSSQPFEALANAKVLLIDEANPVFSTPKAWKVRETLEKIPFIVSFGSFVDETSALAGLILPDHSFLESWTDSLPEAGSTTAIANAAGPGMRPLPHTRATPDLLLEVAGKLKKPVALQWKTFDEVLKASMPEDAWTAAQKSGWAALRAPSSGGIPRSSRDERA